MIGRCRNLSEEKITLPEELQREMLEFFLKTSIPRMKKLKIEQEKARLLSESKSESENEKTDRSDDNGKIGNENGDLC